MLGTKRPREITDDEYDAYVVITTHGSYIGRQLDNIVTKHDLDLNVTKINATKLGICNYLNKSDGEKIGNKIINQIKTKDPFIRSLQNFVRSGKISSPESSAIEIREAIKDLDEDRKAALAKKLRDVPWTKLPGAWDDDAENYQRHADRGYEIYSFKENDIYLDKVYTVSPEDYYDTRLWPFYNSITVINNEGDIVGDIIEMEFGDDIESAISSENKNDAKINLDMYLNRVLDILHDSEHTLSEEIEKGRDIPKMNYKNILIIDLSCSPTKLPSRTVRSVSRPGPGLIAQGTKRSKKAKKKKKKRKKTKKTKR